MTTKKPVDFPIDEVSEGSDGSRTIRFVAAEPSGLKYSLSITLPSTLKWQEAPGDPVLRAHWSAPKLERLFPRGPREGLADSMTAYEYIRGAKPNVYLHLGEKFELFCPDIHNPPH
jgi:hypothetical protein